MTDLFAFVAAKDAAANEPGLARADHPDTSKQAAAAVAPVSGDRRVRVLRMLAAVGSATAEYLETATGMTGNTVRPRLVELRKAELVEVEGRGMTRAGHPAQLYKVTHKGHAALQDIDQKNNQGDHQ